MDKVVDHTKLAALIEGLLEQVAAVESAVERSANKPELLDYQEASSYLHIKLGTLYSYVSTGQIPFIRLGNRLVRFRKRDLDRWLEERTHSAF